MPYVNIKLTPADVTTKQKEELIEGVTNVLVEVLDKNPETTFILIDELPEENWGIGGETVAVRKSQKQSYL